MHNYAFTYPVGVKYDPALPQFIETFYETVDSPLPEDIQRYVEMFTEDAIFKISDGYDAKGHAGMSLLPISSFRCEA